MEPPAHPRAATIHGWRKRMFRDSGEVFLRRRNASCADERLSKERGAQEKQKEQRVFHFGVGSRISNAGRNEVKSVEATVVKRKVYHYR